MRRQTLAVLALAPALALGAQGCGVLGKDAKPTGTAKKASDLEKMRKFAQCMRDNGVDMRDPTDDGRVEIHVSAEPGRPGGPGPGTAPKAHGKAEAAQKKCAHLMPNGGKPPKPKPEDLAKMRAFAKCMRDHGVTRFPDPEPDGGIKIQAGGGTGLDPRSQTFKKAQEACSKYSPDGGKGPATTIGRD